MSESTTATQSGLLIRHDPSIGLLVYSPYTGLVHAVHPDDGASVAAWLDSLMSPPPAEVYARYLWGGWGVPVDEIEFRAPHLLPEPGRWSTVPVTKYPIVVNWLLTGRCQLACPYCYAEDLMRREECEPTAEDVRSVAAAILTLRPLVVVITGGDPLTSPHLATAVQCLSGRAGLVLDTNGCGLTDAHLDLFRRYSMAVRVSLDSERPRINDPLRPFHGRHRAGGGSTHAAVSAICRCLDAGVPVTVQSVATKKTANDLPTLGAKLFRLGVRSWRILKVALSSTNVPIFPRLVGTQTDDGRRVSGKQAHGGYDYVFAAIRAAGASAWAGKMAVQIARNDAPNAVVLVGPDGVFYTESTVRPEKVVLDEATPRTPDPSAFLPRLNMSAHTERYLNLVQSSVEP